jgi:hypothetical protein
VTRLRKMMLKELQRGNYSQITTHNYLPVVADFAKYFGKSLDKLGPYEIRTYQAYLLRERKVTPGTAVNCVAALRFFFVKTLERHQFGALPDKDRHASRSAQLLRPTRTIPQRRQALQRSSCRVKPTRLAGRCQSCPCDPLCSDLPDQSTGPAAARGGDCCPLLPPESVESRNTLPRVERSCFSENSQLAPGTFNYARACRRYPATSLMKR